MRWAGVCVLVALSALAYSLLGVLYEVVRGVCAEDLEGTGDG